MLHSHGLFYPRSGSGSSVMMGNGKGPISLPSTKHSTQNVSHLNSNFHSSFASGNSNHAPVLINNRSNSSLS